LSETTKVKPFSNLRVLYVEDEEFVRITMHRILVKYVGHVDVSVDGEEGWESFLKGEYDLVISDVNMPVLTGLELATRIKDRSKDTPIIFTTAYNDTENIISAINIGVDYFLTKPISIDKLKEILEKVSNRLDIKVAADRSNKILSEYKKAVDASAIFTISDTEGKIIYANDRVCEISGYSKDELIGQPHSIFRHPDMRGEVFAKMWEMIQSKQIWKGIIKNKKKNGEPYYVDSTIVPVMDENDNIVQYLGIRNDITVLMENELALKEAVEKARAADRAKSQFLANMSHEIRTPMNGIVGFLDLISETELNQNQKEYLSIVKSSADHLLEIINDILDISKIESGKLKLENIAINLKEELKNSLYLYNGKALEKGIRLECDIDGGLDTPLKADPVRLRQVISNLISNAVKFTEKGCVKLSVKKLTENSTQIKLLFSIQDNGIGIPKEKIEYIFSPFEQADSSTTRRFGGTGLGLAISKRLIEMMGGNLTVESEVGKGSTFSFTLDLSRCELDHTCEKTHPEHNSKIMFDAKVLVAEDNKVNQKLLKILLEHLGISPQIVENGKEAFEMFVDNEYDMILMDINMPEMDGVSATRLIREYEKENGLNTTPIIALTANALSGDKERFLESGMDGYIPKPIDKGFLLEVLEEHLEGKIKSENRILDMENGNSKGRLKEQIEILKSELGVDEELSLELLKEYFDGIDGEIRLLGGAILEGDLQKIASYSHSIKGSSLNLRLNSIGEVAKEIELKAKEGFVGDYDSLFGILQDAINDYRSEMVNG